MPLTCDLFLATRYSDSRRHLTDDTYPPPVTELVTFCYLLLELLHHTWSICRFTVTKWRTHSRLQRLRRLVQLYAPPTVLLVKLKLCWYILRTRRGQGCSWDPPVRDPDPDLGIQGQNDSKTFVFHLETIQRPPKPETRLCHVSRRLEAETSKTESATLEIVL